MEDTILHPLDAAHWRKAYSALKEELAAILRGSDSATAEAMIRNAFAGKINFPDAYILKRLLRRYRPKEVLEVGSFVGFSTRWILDIVSEWGGHVTSVDPNIRHRMFEAPGDVLRKLNARHLPDRLTVHEAFFGTPGDVYHDYLEFTPKRDRAFVDQVVASRGNIGRDWTKRFDFIFIDGEHDYKSVHENFGIALQLLNPGGCIAFHDALSWAGVRNALRRIARDYAGEALTVTYGRLDHVVLKRGLGKHTDGIGFFKLRAET